MAVLVGVMEVLEYMLLDVVDIDRSVEWINGIYWEPLEGLIGGRSQSTTTISS